MRPPVAQCAAGQDVRRAPNRSLARLIGVPRDLVEIVKLAIQRTAVDFTVVEGVRKRAQQREYVTKGASQTMTASTFRRPMALATPSTWRRWCGARSLGTTGRPSPILPG